MLHHLATAATLLAQAQGRSYSLSWALILLCVVLGLMITLRPNKRTSEVKRP